jgi:hypothetical protein
VQHYTIKDRQNRQEKPKWAEAKDVALKMRWAKLVTQSLLDFSQKYLNATLN